MGGEGVRQGGEISTSMDVQTVSVVLVLVSSDTCGMNMQTVLVLSAVTHAEYICANKAVHTVATMMLRRPEKKSFCTCRGSSRRQHTPSPLGEEQQHNTAYIWWHVCKHNTSVCGPQAAMQVCLPVIMITL